MECSPKRLFSKFEILPEIKFCIVIPVKDEERYIEQTLTSFATQKDLEGNHFDFKSFEVLVLANNCSDQTVYFIKKFQHQNPHLNLFLEERLLPKHEANIGFVRKILMQTAYERLSENGGGVLLTTDGDTTVSKDWIAQNNLEIEKGAEAVGGRILLLPAEAADLDPCTYAHYLKDEKYHLLLAKLEATILKSSIDPNPRHHQHFNGSFALTTECFRKSGGIPAVTHLEDIAFFKTLEKMDVKIRHSNNVVVYTSARCVGRTEIGLSYQLNEWRKRGSRVEDFFVESAKTTVNRFILKKNLREIYNQRPISEENFRKELQRVFPEMTMEKESYRNFESARYFGEWFATFHDYVEEVTRFPPEFIDCVISELEQFCADDEF